MKKRTQEHKCWYCMTDIEKNEWLKSEGFKIRYPIIFTRPGAVTQTEADVYLDRLYNPNFITFDL